MTSEDMTTLSAGTSTSVLGRPKTAPAATLRTTNKKQEYYEPMGANRTSIECELVGLYGERACEGLTKQLTHAPRGPSLS